MLNISGIHEGFVLDHIKAGMSLQIYRDLKLDKLDCTVAIIKNAKLMWMMTREHAISGRHSMRFTCVWRLF